MAFKNKGFIEDDQHSCIKLEQGSLWNTKCNPDDVVSVDMVAHHLLVFLELVECEPNVSQFGHPTHGRIRVTINYLLNWIYLD